MILAAVAAVGLTAYLAAVLRVHRHARRRWPGERVAAAVAAACLVVVAGVLTGGHVAVGHGDVGAVPHMVQHVLLGMVAPVAVVAARPVSLLLAVSPTSARPVLARVVRSRLAHVLGHPALAAVPVVLGLHLLLLTPLLATSLQVGWVHALVLTHTLLAGTWFAWAVVGGDPAPPRTTLLLRLAAIVVVAGTHAHLGTLLYARAPALPPGVPWEAGELRRAALVMYYGGDAAELLLATAVVLTWYRAGRGRARAPRPRPSSSSDPIAVGPTTASWPVSAGGMQ